MFNAEIKGYFNEHDQRPSILDELNAKEKSFVDESLNGKGKNGDESIYGTIRNVDDKGKENEDVIYRTMDGGVIRSVHPPGKGKGTKYQVGRSSLYVVFMCGLIFSNHWMPVSVDSGI